MKVVINICYGGFGLSEKALDLYVAKKGLKMYKHKSGFYTTIPVEDYEVIAAKENEDWDKPGFKGHESNKYCWGERKIKRNDQTLVEVVEELGPEANSKYAELAVIEIPDDVDFVIERYDGSEWIAEKHRTWA